MKPKKQKPGNRTSSIVNSVMSISKWKWKRRYIICRIHFGVSLNDPESKLSQPWLLQITLLRTGETHDWPFLQTVNNFSVRRLSSNDWKVLCWAFICKITKVQIFYLKISRKHRGLLGYFCCTQSHHNTVHRNKNWWRTRAWLQLPFLFPSWTPQSQSKEN